MGSRAVPRKAAGMEAAGSVTLNTGLHHFGLHIFETNTHSSPAMFVFHYMSECSFLPKISCDDLRFEVCLRVQMPPEGNGKEKHPGEMSKSRVCPSCRWLCI